MLEHPGYATVTDLDDTFYNGSLLLDTSPMEVQNMIFPFHFIIFKALVCNTIQNTSLVHVITT